MKTKLLFITFFVISWLSYSQVVINEIDPDTPSTDQKEFIELKSTTSKFFFRWLCFSFF